MIQKRRVGDVLIAATLLPLVGLGQSAGSPQFGIRNVIRVGSRVELVKGGFQGLEGPTPTPDGGLYFSATAENRIYKLDRNGTIAVWRENTNGTNGLYALKDGRLLCAEGNGRRVLSVTPAGIVTALASEYKGSPLRQPNDLIPDRKGGIYFTDPARRPAPDVAPKEPGNVYYIRPGGEVALIEGEIARPNGITLSIDEKTLYLDDTEGQFVYAFDMRGDGSIRNKRPFVKLLEPEQGSSGLRSLADGMALDSKGRLYVATAAGIQVIDSRGRHLGIIRLPARARNLAFGGARRQTLYLTALESLYRIEMLAEGPKGRAK